MVLASVNFSAMADAKHENYKALMLKRTDDAMVADAVSPELAKSALETLADASWMVEFAEPFVEKLRDTASDGFVELIEFSLGSGVKLNRPLLV